MSFEKKHGKKDCREQSRTEARTCKQGWMRSQQKENTLVSTQSWKLGNDDWVGSPIQHVTAGIVAFVENESSFGSCQESGI